MNGYNTRGFFFLEIFELVLRIFFSASHTLNAFYSPTQKREEDDSIQSFVRSKINIAWPFQHFWLGPFYFASSAHDVKLGDYPKNSNLGHS